MSLTNAERRALALQEVHASNPRGRHIVATLELRHPTLTEPVRVVADNDDLTAKLEETAPVDAGETVTFSAMAFQATPPERADGRWPEMELALDGAALAMEPHLEAAMLSDDPVDIVWREYIREDAAEGPGRVILGLELDSTRSGDAAVTGTAGVYGLDRRFGQTFTLEEYPGLV